MVWTINLMIFVLLTTLTGTILFGIWYGIGRLLEYLGFINVIYELLKAVVLFWYLPVSCLVLMYGSVSGSEWGSFLFLYTPVMYWISILFCIVWIPGAILFLLRYIEGNRYLRKRYRDAVPVEGVAWECFERVCKDMHLKPDKFEVLQHYKDASPKILLLKKPTIIVPVKELAEEEYRVAFVHELTHYKQRALHLKHATTLAMAVHFFNPAIRMLDRKVQFWGEYACDYEAIPYCEGWQQYFYTIITIMIKNEEPAPPLAANLVEGEGGLEDRILRMKRSYTMKSKKKWMAALTVAAMMTVSTVSVSAATIFTAEAYKGVYDISVVEHEENFESDSSQELVPQTADGLDEGFVEEEGVVDYRPRGVTGFAWDLRKNASCRTPFFDATQGQTITVTVISSPSDAVVHAGIIKPDGSRVYVVGSGTFVYPFEVDTTGSYSVYVQNMSNGAIEVKGSYIL